MLVRSVTLSALSILATTQAGCGGGPCSEYCNAARDCYVTESIEGNCDVDAATDACVDACESGVNAVPSSSRGPMEECLTCISGRLADTCELDEDVLSACIDPCLEAGEAAFEAFGETFSNEIESSDAGCSVDDTSSSCNFSSSDDGTSESCSIACDSGAGASCVGESGGEVSCSCSGTGMSFSTFCAELDESTVAEVCG